jgi:cytochrome c556
MTVSGIRAIACLLAAWLGASGCAAPAQWRYEEALAETPAAAEHAVHETRLQELMRDLDRLRRERLPKAFDVRELESRQAREVATVARAMAASAARIASVEPAGLDDREQRQFRELAAHLQQQTARLADDALWLSADQLRARLAEVDATCGRCHGRFRISGPTRDD